MLRLGCCEGGEGNSTRASEPQHKLLAPVVVEAAAGGACSSNACTTGAQRQPHEHTLTLLCEHVRAARSGVGGKHEVYPKPGSGLTLTVMVFSLSI
jgi:hypothetical protein